MGQLAYDKGMRVLAASQTDSVALESEKVKHGLLTYALILDGLEQRKAARKANVQISISDWLKYGSDRVPSLYEEIKKLKPGEKLGLKREWGVVTVDSKEIDPNERIQKPSLFDFGSSSSNVQMLKTK